jgi:hypothetical protein
MAWTTANSSEDRARLVLLTDPLRMGETATLFVRMLESVKLAAE